MKTIEEIERDAECYILKARERQIYMDSRETPPTEQMLDEMMDIVKRGEELRKKQL